MGKLVNIKKISKKDVYRVMRLHRLVVRKTNALSYSKEKIKEWVKPITVNNIKQQLKVKSTLWYGLWYKDKLIGFCQFPVSKGWIYQLNINQRYQNKGHGKILLDFMEEKFKKAGVYRIRLYSTINAKDFYSHMGYRIVKPYKSRLEKSYINMYEMVKVLKKS